MADFGLDLGPWVMLVTVEVQSAGRGVTKALRASQRRALEFQAGRRAAAGALAFLGIRTEVPRARNGCPVWPTGVVGSISHGAGIAAAAVADSANYAGIGIDIEPVLDPAASAEVRTYVASTDELSLVAKALPELSDEARVTLIFSCKESLYKCLFPQTLRFMEFDHVRVVGVEPNGSAPRVSLRLEVDLGNEHRRDARFEASFCIARGAVRTAVLASAASKNR